jgi:hypothetical protein
MHIQLQMLYHHNQIDVMNEDPTAGALDWRNLTHLKRRWEAGEISDEEILSAGIRLVQPFA